MDLSRQFGPTSPRGVFRTEYNPGDTGWVSEPGVSYRQYNYAKEHEYAPRGWASYQSLQVKDFAPESVMVTEHGPSREPRSIRGEVVRSEAQRDWNYHTVGPGRDQPKLFGWGETPGKSKLEWWGGHESARPMSATMLGIAQHETRQRFGRDVLPSEDLSPHSSRIVSKLQGAGLAGGRAAQQTNDLTFQVPDMYWDVGASKRMSHQEVAAGREVGRDIVKRLRTFKKGGDAPAPSVTQGEQLRLF